MSKYEALIIFAKMLECHLISHECASKSCAKCDFFTSNSEIEQAIPMAIIALSKEDKKEDGSEDKADS